jgi:hypothetical protein
MQDKKQIIGLILSVVLSVGLVVVGVNAATTVGNDVTVGNALTVTGTTTLGTSLTVAATTTLSATTTIAGTVILTNAVDLMVGTGTSTFAGDVSLGNAAADNILITGTPTISPTTTFSAGATFAGDVTASLDLNVTASTTLNGEVSLGDAAGDNIRVNGTISSATTTLLSIGGGPMISHVYSTSTVLDFNAIPALSCATSSTSLAGVVAGDVVTLGMAQEIAGATSTVVWNAWVPVASFVYVRVCNIGSSAPTPNFSPGTVRIDVWQH